VVTQKGAADKKPEVDLGYEIAQATFSGGHTESQGSARGASAQYANTA